MVDMGSGVLFPELSVQYIEWLVMEAILLSGIIAAAIIIIIVVMSLKKTKSLLRSEIEHNKKVESDKRILIKRIKSLLLLDTALSSNVETATDYHCGCFQYSEWGHCSGHITYKYRNGICVYVTKQGFKSLSAETDGETVFSILKKENISLQSIEFIDFSQVRTEVLEESDCG